jgi:patatin-like phospholipase/acyl hydrolase
MAFKRKILSIDGGGIRGIIPALLLDYIETKTEKPIAEMFDLIAGTSTGAVLALGMTKPKSDGSPEFTPAAIAEMYREEGEDIDFPDRLMN